MIMLKYEKLNKKKRTGKTVKLTASDRFSENIFERLTMIHLQYHRTCIK